MIKWQEAYSVGVDELDAQHKDLFTFSNDLDGILQDRDVSKEMLGGALAFMGKYVSNHFGKEEACMNRFACPIAANNKLAHDQFIQAYRVFEKQIGQQEDGYGLLKELHAFLERWLVDHICTIDTQLKPCVHQ